MTAPPPGPGQHPPYGQQPYGQQPYTPPPSKGVPAWFWVVSIPVVIALLICLCGGVGYVAMQGGDETSTGAPPPTSGESTGGPTSDPTSEPTSTSTSGEPSTSTSTSTWTSTSTSTSTSYGSTTTTPTSVPSASVPPPPAGTPNTDASLTISSDEVERQIARGMKQVGHKVSDISCPSRLVLIKGRTTTCTAPVPGTSRRSDVKVKVAWAVMTSSTDSRYYLTFEQSLR